ncbi:MAG TPA: DUF1573 domain-containing protein [Candidatus Didemnitutus sp.]|nr:DUF1573 domain-containing protein [Candidatus Didemnitutus sp.]
MKTALLLAALAAIVPSARAVEWDAVAREVKAAPFQTDVDLEFGFHNTGSHAVQIQAVRTGCHCVSARADRDSIEAGGRGRILAHFSVGDRVGLYERTITVTTDESPEPQYLTVRIDIPEIATVTPRVVDWPIGGAADEKTVEIDAGPGLQVDFTEATATNNAFAITLQPVELGRRYRLVIKPRSTAEHANAAVRIKGRERTGHDVLVSAYANIR